MQKTSVSFWLMIVSMAIADDKLALAPADRRHGVDGLDARLQRLVHGTARDDAGGLEFHPPELARLDVALSIDGISERVDDTAHEGLAHRDLDDAVGTAHEVALANVGGLTHQRDADVVLLEVEDQTVDATGELHELARHGVLETVYAGDTVTDREHGPGFGDVDLAVVVLDLALQDVGDFARLDVHRSVSPREGVVQLCELRFQAAVKDDAADLRDSTADQVLVDANVELDLASGMNGQRTAQAVAL